MNPLTFIKQTNFYKGKVRDVYTIDNQYLVMIASNRISAFDVILPEPIPYKGQVLNQIASYMLGQCKDICPNWLLETPLANVSIGKLCKPFAIEMVVRGNLVGHAWRTYSTGARVLCGAEMPNNLKENDYFPTPLITPSTKAAEGHDEDITPTEIINRGLCTAAEWDTLCRYSLALFERGKQLAAKQGLVLADTKYEFGKIGDVIYLMDEIHTPDSSRYFYAEGFEERLTKNEKQKQLSKEFLREWLISENFMGKEEQVVPEMTDEKVKEISERYIELFENITGKVFAPSEVLSDKELVEIVNLTLRKYC
jgi:phosphoribosylaminoimidazole-succinocarboxamide synthase